MGILFKGLIFLFLCSSSVLQAIPIEFYLFNYAGPGDTAEIHQGSKFLRINGHDVAFYTFSSIFVGNENQTISKGVLDSKFLNEEQNAVLFTVEVSNNGFCKTYRKNTLKVHKQESWGAYNLVEIATLTRTTGEKIKSLSTAVNMTLEQLCPAAAYELKIAREIAKGKELKRVDEEKSAAAKKQADREHEKLLENLERIFKKAIRPVCFTDGTKIKAANEHGQMVYRELQTIAVGDNVWTCNLTSKACELRPVRAAIKREVPKVLQIATDTETLEVTPEHPFYVTGKGWVEAKKLKIGDNLYSRLESVNKIASIDEVFGNFQVYNIEVEAKEYDNQNYFVTESDLLVHNCNVLAGAALVASGAMLLAGGSIAGVVVVLNGGITVARIGSADTLAEAAENFAYDLALQVGLGGAGIAANRLGTKAGRVLEFGKLTKTGRDKILSFTKDVSFFGKKNGIASTDLAKVHQEAQHFSKGGGGNLYSAAEANKPLGLGSTGRASPADLQEHAAMLVTRADPQAGKPIGGLVMGDRRWQFSEGWQKMQTEFVARKSNPAAGDRKIIIHYVRNTKTGKVDDFKFKE